MIVSIVGVCSSLKENFPFVSSNFSSENKPRPDENIGILFQNRFTNHLLSSSDGLIARNTKIGEIFQKSSNENKIRIFVRTTNVSMRIFSLAIAFLTQKLDERVDFTFGDVFFEQFFIVVQKGGDRVLGENVETDLRLHKRKLFSDGFLKEENFSFSSTVSFVRT